MSQQAEWTAATAAAPAAGAIPANPLRALISPYTWLATIHLLSDLFVGVVSFSVLVTLLAFAAALLLVALLGVPVWVLAARAAAAFSAFERAGFRLTLGVDIPAPALPARGPFLTYAARLAGSAVVWRQITYQLLLPVLGAIGFAVTLTVWSGPLALILLPVYYFALPAGHADLGPFQVGDLGTAVAVALAGLALLVLVSPAVVRALASLQAAVGRLLLGPYSAAELATRVDQLEERRRQVVDSAETERRRIERDLHDGAQQRLVALAMTLGRAKSRLRDDSSGAGQLVDQAHEEAKQAIIELRNLTRGIHPPVLTDRGLDAALSGLAARAPVPVRVEVDVGTRPSPSIEAIAYFVVAEALTNVARHARARRAHVAVSRAGGLLRVVVTDDGTGGADPAGGTGLAGLADRVAGVDGRFTLQSPPGGPTVLTVELPCT